LIGGFAQQTANQTTIPKIIDHKKRMQKSKRILSRVITIMADCLKANPFYSFHRNMNQHFDNFFIVNQSSLANCL